MGKRGPKTQPAAIRRARGNPGHRRRKATEPQPKGRLPECPSHLSANARKTWDAFAEQLTESKIATSLDAAALSMLCSSYALYLDALEKVQQFGPVWMEKGSGKIPKFVYSPHWAVMNREWKNVKQMLAEFGMTPSSRTNVQPTESEADNNPFAAYLKVA